MSSAIVRHCIANSTIDEVLKNRKILRDTVSKEILGVVKGWGVWVETIEITDVKISSSSLFKDMQSKFREEQKLKAELERMEIERQLKEEKLKSELENSKKQSNNDTNSKIYKASKDYESFVENQKIKIKQKNMELRKHETETRSSIKQESISTQNEINTNKF